MDSDYFSPVTRAIVVKPLQPSLNKRNATPQRRIASNFSIHNSHSHTCISRRILVPSRVLALPAYVTQEWSRPLFLNRLDCPVRVYP